MTTTATTAPVRTSTTRRVPLVVTAIGAVVAGAVVTEVFATLARAAGVDVMIGSGGSPRADVPFGGFFAAVAMWGAVGVVIALAISRWSRTPRRTWNRTAWTLTVLSLAPIAPVADASVATEITLACAHLVAAAVVLPLVARRLTVTNHRR